MSAEVTRRPSSPSRTRRVTRPSSASSVVVVLSILVAGTSGCGSSDDFPVARVSGRLICNGQPVPHATVIFEPLATGNSALSGKQGIGETDANGEFRLSTYGTHDGAVVGQHRVRVAPPDRESHPDFRCGCVLNPEIDVMRFEVRADADNQAEIMLSPVVGQQPVVPDDD